MWDILDIVKESERASNILTAIFFSMGHMLYHTQDTIQAPESKKVILDTKTDEEGNKYEDILSEESWTATKITWFRLHIDEDILKALNNEIGTIVLSDGKRISYPALTSTSFIVTTDRCSLPREATILFQDHLLMKESLILLLSISSSFWQAVILGV